MAAVMSDPTNQQIRVLREAAIEQVRVRVLPDGRLTREHAALYLGTTPKTLAQWQWQGKGPPSKKIGAARFYYLDDLDAFIRSK